MTLNCGYGYSNTGLLCGRLTDDVRPSIQGFGDVTAAETPDSSATKAYYVLTGLGVGTLRMWRFVEPADPKLAPDLNHLYAINTNGYGWLQSCLLLVFFFFGLYNWWKWW